MTPREKLRALAEITVDKYDLKKGSPHASVRASGNVVEYRLARAVLLLLDVADAEMAIKIPSCTSETCASCAPLRASIAALDRELARLFPDDHPPPTETR